MAQDKFTNGYALLIGVNESLIPGYALPTVAKDATALQDVLVHPDRCAYLPENVRLLTGSAASREGILGGLSWLKARVTADRDENATVVLYYSGHGAYRREDNSYYLLPYDLRSPLISSLLRATDLAVEIEQVRPRRMLVILDCCHAGGMDIKGDDLFALERLAKAAAPAEARPTVALLQGQGRAVLSSSTAAESSYVRADRKMSIFTYHLVEALTGYAQPNGATDVLVSDIMSYVSRQVPQSARAEYNVSQTPFYQVSGENFPVALILGGAGKGNGQVLPDPLTTLPAAEFGPATSIINTGGGAYVSGGVYNTGNMTQSGAINTYQKSVAGDEIRGSKILFSGDFRDAILIIGSYFSKVTLSILNGQRGDATTRADLNALVASLQVELEQAIAAERIVEAKTIARKLADTTAALEAEDEEMIAINGRALERAAQTLSSVQPGIAVVTRQITAAMDRLKT